MASIIIIILSEIPIWLFDISWQIELEGLHICVFLVAGGGGVVFLFIIWGSFCPCYFNITKIIFCVWCALFNVQNNVSMCIAFAVKKFKNEKWAFGLIVMKTDKDSKNSRDHSFSTFKKFSLKLTFLTHWYAHVRLCECTKWITPQHLHDTLFFIRTSKNWALGVLFLKLSWFLEYFVLNSSFFFPDFF